MAQKVKPKIIGDRKWIRYLTVFVSLLGLIISGYGYYVEEKLEQDKHYKPLCDYNKEIRCSKALSSKYAKGFGFLGNVFGDKHVLNQYNTFYGILFYVLMAGLGYARNSKASLVQLNLALISVCVSAYLAYVMVFIEKEYCPVCISTYMINLIILLLTLFKGTPRIADSRDMGSYKKTDKTDGSPGKSGDDFRGRQVKEPKSTPSSGSSYAQAVKHSDAKKRRD